VEIVAVHRQHIECAELDFLAMPAGVQSVEIGDAIDTQHNGLSVDHKLIDAVLQGGLGDPRISLRPVIAATGYQADTIAVTLGSRLA
jgi:hypothetical protein